MSDLPQPLTPADCNLRGLTWMLLDVGRVIDSDLFGLSSGDEFKTAFRLWAKSWAQVPAASLPDDDKLLAHLAGLSENPAKWKRVKVMALRGFVKCSDGRLYHPVIAEKALEAMQRRDDHEEKEENEENRQKRHRQRRSDMFAMLREHEIVPGWKTPTAELERLVASLPETKPVTQSVTPVTQNVTPATDLQRACNAPATAIDSTGQDSKHKNQEEALTRDSRRLPRPTGDNAAPVERAVKIAVFLRQRGIVGANGSNPHILGWADNPKVTDDLLAAALSVIASRNLDRQPAVGYLVGIVADLLNPKPVTVAKPKFDDWHKTDAGTMRKARELGFGDGRAGETMQSLRDRCWAEIRRREHGGNAA